MIRTNAIGILQKTYDDCHLVCSTAIYFESKREEAEALRCWKNALDQITYHKAYRLPSTYQPKSETEKALYQSLRQLELQCKERISLLEALDASRHELEAAGAVDHDLAYAPAHGQYNWIGQGNIPPFGYPDLAKPPSLPIRKPSAPPLSAEVEKRSKARKGTSSEPQSPWDESRSPSPDKKSYFRSTLRPIRKTKINPNADHNHTASSSRRPLASKAASSAWTGTMRPEYAPLVAALPPSLLDQSGPLEKAKSSQEHMNASRLDVSTPTHDSHPLLEPVQTERRPSSDKITPTRLLGVFNTSRSAPRQKSKPGRQVAIPTAHPIPSDDRDDSVEDLKPRSPRDPLANSSSRHSIDPVPSKTARARRKSLPKTASDQEAVRHEFIPQPGPPESDRETSSEDEVSPVNQADPLTKEPDWTSRAEDIMAHLPRGVDAQAARHILEEIAIEGDEVHWADIAGLEVAKTALKENVVYPFLRPDLFKGLREPARGILLFGPPGTGKTMLARAVATESSSTFFAISATSLTSKFLGESEKLVRALFVIAKALAPSVIFVDEIDSLLSSRTDTGEHETSRRIKTEFLIQWSDLARAAAGRESISSSTGDPSRVLVLAATNAPWAIDEAARRRFVRRQYIPLPETDVRAVHFRTLLAHQKHDLEEPDFNKLVLLTDGFSGSDITALAKDAAMGPLRALGDRLLSTRFDDIRPISLKDFEASLTMIRPSVSKAGLQQFEDWASEYGERGG